MTPRKKLSPKEEVKLDRKKSRQRSNRSKPSSSSSKNKTVTHKRGPFSVLLFPLKLVITVLARFRDLWWRYPDFLASLIRRTRPVSYIVIFMTTLLLAAWLLPIISAVAKPISPSFDTLVEGVVGQPTRINPIYITNNSVDTSLCQLVFNPLVRITPSGGAEPELAESWEITGDNKVYIFYLRQDVKWHDGEEFTADDVVFTFNMVYDSGDYASYASDIQDVEIKKLDKHAVQFTLPDVSAVFLENINFGILPEHVLKNVAANELYYHSFNTAPVGTGPYKVRAIDQTEASLVANGDYFKASPKISKIVLKFFPNEDEAEAAIKLGKIHTLGNISKDLVSSLDEYPKYKLLTAPLTRRSRVLYFNLKDGPVIKDVEARRGLSLAINRRAIIDEIVGPDGMEAVGPIPPLSWAYSEEGVDRYTYSPEAANARLEEAGWQFKKSTHPETLPETEDQADDEVAESDEDSAEPISPEAVKELSEYRFKEDTKLEATITFLDTPDNQKIAEMIKDDWSKVGANAILLPKTFDELTREVIPTRDYESLLFEVESSIDPDDYNLWHSTKVDYPGQNLSGYEYERVDILLERARQTMDQQARKEDYSLYQKYILRDIPIVYLYHPNYSYLVHEDLKGVDLERMTIPSERFFNVEEWEFE